MPHRNTTVSVVVPALGLLMAVCAAQAGEKSGASRGSDIARLSWMAGTWRGNVDGDVLEEIWSPPAGDCIMASFRWIKKGKVWIYELATISDDDGTLVFRLKHFDRRLVGWEEKDEALTYPIKSIGEKEVVFENPERDHPRRFIYRLEDEQTLAVRLEGLDKDGKPAVDKFRFRRQ